MNKKFIYKIVIDMIMTVLLLFLMARQRTGDSAHEWIGAAMLILWIVHHILNRSWYSHLFKGKYTPVRILQMVINFAVLLSMLGLTVSGIILSREVFAFLKNQFLSYLFLTSSFVFFDFERPVLLFFTEYIAIMGLFIFLAHYSSRGIHRLAGRRKKPVEEKK